jgi:hypothetical protein
MTLISVIVCKLVCRIFMKNQKFIFLRFGTFSCPSNYCQNIMTSSEMTHFRFEYKSNKTLKTHQ